jgi:hypothetical protein
MAFIDLDVLLDAAELAKFRLDADAFLVGAIHDTFGDGNILGEGLVTGHPSIVIATKAHNAAIPFFLGPNHDALIAPVPTCISAENPPRYEPTTYGAFTARLRAF